MLHHFLVLPSTGLQLFPQCPHLQFQVEHLRSLSPDFHFLDLCRVERLVGFLLLVLDLGERVSLEVGVFLVAEV